IEQCGAVASTRQEALNHFNIIHGDCHCEDCIKEEMANEHDTVSIPSEPPNDSQATSPVLQPDNSLNLESGYSNEQMETMAIVNVPNGPPKDKQATDPQPNHSLVVTQESDNQSKQLETTEETGETSIVGLSSSAKRKMTENFTPSNSAEEGIDSDDAQVIPAKRKRVDQNKTRLENEEKPNHYKCYKVRSLYCWADGCNRSFPDAPMLDKHLVDDHGIFQFRCLVAGCSQSFSIR